LKGHKDSSGKFHPHSNKSRLTSEQVGMKAKHNSTIWTVGKGLNKIKSFDKKSDAKKFALKNIKKYRKDGYHGSVDIGYTRGKYGKYTFSESV